MSSRPRVKVVYEKSKKPEPLECMPGGETKIDTSSNTHHRNVMMANKTVKYRKNRTLHRLYGDTYINNLLAQDYNEFPIWILQPWWIKQKGARSLQLDHQDSSNHHGLVEVDEYARQPHENNEAEDVLGEKLQVHSNLHFENEDENAHFPKLKDVRYPSWNPIRRKP